MGMIILFLSWGKIFLFLMKILLVRKSADPGGVPVWVAAGDYQLRAYGSTEKGRTRRP